MYEEFLDEQITNKINVLSRCVKKFNGKHGKHMSEEEYQRLKDLRDEINKEMRLKSGKPKQLFIIVLCFYKKTRVFRVQCAFTSMDKLKYYYPNRLIHYGFENEDWVDDSDICFNLYDL